VKKWVFTQILGNCSPLKTDCKPYYFITMSKQLLISMLRKGANGQEILNILDVIASDTVTEDNSESFAAPTLDEISF
jgi:hypothetical protein